MTRLEKVTKIKNKGLPEWQIKFKGDKEEQYDGIYYPKPHDHDEWLKKVENNKLERCQKRDKDKMKTGSSSKSDGEKNKLALNDNLKAILCTNCGLYNEQVKTMIDSYNEKTSWSGCREGHLL
eukprot:13081446-Ditylum_brightwellii.AAC.1